MAERQRISLHGIWLIAWTAWLVCWLATLVFAPQWWGFAGMVSALKWEFAVFVPLELGGVIDMRDDPPDRPQTAKTLSHFFQYLVGMGRAWYWLGGAGALGLAVSAGLVFWDASPVLAVGAALTMSIWLLLHFLNVRKHG